MITMDGKCRQGFLPAVAGGFLFAFSISGTPRGLPTEPQTSAETISQKVPTTKWWRSIPRTAFPEPTDPSELRLLELRGRYFDSAIGEPWPLDNPPLGIGSGSSSGSCGPGETDAPPFFQDEAIVVGTFKDFRVHLSPTHRSIYTRITLVLDQVLDPGPSGVKAGQEADYLIPGGTVRLDNGSVLSHRILQTDRKYSIEPGHRYLFFLQFRPEGNFFVGRGDWELRDGWAIPKNSCYVAPVREGRSHYAGMSEAQFLDAIDEAIQKHQQGAVRH